MSEMTMEQLATMYREHSHHYRQHLAISEAEVERLCAEVDRLRAELGARVQCDDCGAIGDVAVGTDGHRHLEPSGECAYTVISLGAEQGETGGAA